MGTFRKRRFGDRSDGRRLRTLDPFSVMIPFIMKHRNDSSNYFSDAVEITDAERYLRAKRAHGYPGMGLLHLFIATYIRTASQYPGINRFVSGQRIYARKDIEFVMIIKKEMRTDAPETSIKINFDYSDTIYDVYRKMTEQINLVKKEGEDTVTDNLAKVLMKLPRLFLKLIVRVLEIMDYFGIMPKSILRASPFHGTLVITDLGSIGLPAIYHHLYNFGNMPIFIALGAKRKTRELRPDGIIGERKYIEYKLVMDERCCDGFYFSQAFRLFRSILRKPHILDVPPDVIVEDID
ncbi:MAG: hypothetical protein FWC75_09310 [Oscillospiraceae bacterium]|nr:hypothetical protein [Oscillospiraceae bacterium]